MTQPLYQATWAFLQSPKMGVFSVDWIYTEEVSKLSILWEELRDEQDKEQTSSFKELHERNPQEEKKLEVWGEEL